MIIQLYDCFKHWADGKSVFIISDTHFGDSDCKLMDKNWLEPEEAVKVLNKYVSGQTLICLGDCGDLEYFKKIKAKYKVLIKGNHDDKAKKLYTDIFNEVYDGPLMIGEKILLSHEPIYYLPFTVNIHGHDHNASQMLDYHLGKHLNLASNICNYTPISLSKEIEKGLLADVENIHRITIDKAVERKNG